MLSQTCDFDGGSGRSKVKVSLPTQRAALLDLEELSPSVVVPARLRSRKSSAQLVSQLVLTRTNQSQPVSSGLNWLEPVSINPSRSQLIWFQLVSTGFHSFQLILTVFKWLKPVSTGLHWSQPVPAGLPQLVSAGSRILQSLHEVLDGQQPVGHRHGRPEGGDGGHGLLSEGTEVRGHTLFMVLTGSPV